MPPERVDAFDVITDEGLTTRTASLRRNFAMKLAAQHVYDAWYSYEDPKKLAEALNKPEERFEPSQELIIKLLELSSSIDSKMLDVLRDVGVGAPQFGVAGMSGPLPPPNTNDRSRDMPQQQPRRRGIFR